jgi:hypothetical protein
LVPERISWGSSSCLGKASSTVNTTTKTHPCRKAWISSVCRQQTQLQKLGGLTLQPALL